MKQRLLYETVDTSSKETLKGQNSDIEKNAITINVVVQWTLPVIFDMEKSIHSSDERDGAYLRGGLNRGFTVCSSYFNLNDNFKQNLLL